MYSKKEFARDSKLAVAQTEESLPCKLFFICTYTLRLIKKLIFYRQASITKVQIPTSKRRKERPSFVFAVGENMNFS